MLEKRIQQTTDQFPVSIIIIFSMNGKRSDFMNSGNLSDRRFLASLSP